MSASTYRASDADKARSAILRRLDEPPHQSLFAWPDDGFAAEWWAYHVHVAWVDAWNVQGRTESAETFLRAWLATPAFDAAWSKAVEWARRPDTYPAHLWLDESR